MASELAATVTTFSDYREELEKIADAWLRPGEMELRAGEMTAQEKLTAKAIVISIASAIRAHPLPAVSGGEVTDRARERAYNAGLLFMVQNPDYAVHSAASMKRLTDLIVEPASAQGREHNLVGEPGSIHCSRCGASEMDDIAMDCRSVSDGEMYARATPKPLDGEAAIDNDMLEHLESVVRACSKERRKDAALQEAVEVAVGTVKNIREFLSLPTQTCEATLREKCRVILAKLCGGQE